MKVLVHIDKCIGAGHCASVAPRVFAQGEDDGLVVLLNERPAADEHEAVRSAARLCPSLAIKIEEDS